MFKGFYRSEECLCIEYQLINRLCGSPGGATQKTSYSFVNEGFIFYTPELYPFLES